MLQCPHMQSVEQMQRLFKAFGSACSALFVSALLPPEVRREITPHLASPAFFFFLSFSVSSNWCLLSCFSNKQSCLIEGEKDCPKCLIDNRKIMGIKRALEQNSGQQEQFFKQVPCWCWLFLFPRLFFMTLELIIIIVIVIIIITIQLDASTDGFVTVAEYFGRGIFNTNASEWLTLQNLEGSKLRWVWVREDAVCVCS